MPDQSVPSHIAIVMDGNGRWASERNLPRFMGHKRGVEQVRTAVQYCAKRGVKALTLFAFSTENWKRPVEEVDYLMGLFQLMLNREVKRLHKHNVRLRVIGERSRFSDRIQAAIVQAEALTAGNTGLSLSIAANYGGQWDIAEAARAMCREAAAGRLDPETVTPEMIRERISLQDLPEPDLFIRTGGEKRISNFMLWQLAYAELYFTDTFWPDFDEQALDAAIDSFGSRQRRFGRTSEQVAGSATDTPELKSAS